MYPIALEKQYQKFFIQEFNRVALAYTNDIIAKLNRELKTDSKPLNDFEYEIISFKSDIKNWNRDSINSNKIIEFFYPYIRTDSDDFSRLDSITQMHIFLTEIREKYGNKIDSGILARKIEKHYRLIDAWSRDKTNEAIKKIYTRLNTPQQPAVTGRATPKNMPGELWMPAINLRKNFSEGLIHDVVKQNVSLINQAYSDHFNDITSIVKEGLKAGKGSRTIAAELMERTGVNQSKAKFWARDQASKFFGETTRIRQKEAGIPGYVWRTVGGRRTRDSHLALEGTYHDWNNPPMVQSGRSSRALHPGEDYNCRCWAEPALGPEAAERDYKIPADDNYFENIRPGIKPAYFGSVGDNSLTGRTIIKIDNPGLKRNVEGTISAIGKLIKIDTEKIKPLTVVQMDAADPYFSNSLGYHFKSGHIAIKPGPFDKTTLIHEFFHWIDIKVLPPSSRKEYQNIIKVIQKSDACSRLKRLKTITRDSGTREYLEYLMTPKELFARAMEQYISRSGIDADITRQFQDKFADMEIQYWIDNDFENIYYLIDSMFKELGWK